MKRIKLVVAYDGTRYCGWQIQDNGVTIEEMLNRALTKLTGEEIRVTGASRTDSGVHAKGNIAVFDTETRIRKRSATRSISICRRILWCSRRRRRRLFTIPENAIL